MCGFQRNAQQKLDDLLWEEEGAWVKMGEVLVNVEVFCKSGAQAAFLYIERNAAKKLMSALWGD